MSNTNQEGYHDRLAQVKGILKRYDLQSAEITPLAYDESQSFPYNNFIYKLELAIPTQRKTLNEQGFSQYFTSGDLSENISSFILRMSNPKAFGMNTSSFRLQNEVASMWVVRQGFDAINPGFGRLIPNIYAWSQASETSEDLSWMLMEYMNGIPLDEHFHSQPLQVKEGLISQISDVLAGLERCQLPQGITSHCGLSIDSYGHISSAQMTTVRGGPWSTYDAVWKARLLNELQEAGKSSTIDGWKPNGVSKRLDLFINDGVSNVLSSANVASQEVKLIHGDLTMNNILVDPSTNRLTAILDFDFACITHPAHEFFLSLHDLGCNVGGLDDEDSTKRLLPEALYSGNFDTDGPEEGIDLWTYSKVFNASMSKRGTRRPSDFPGIRELHHLAAIERLICPFHLSVPFMIEQMSEQKLAEARIEAETFLVAQLEHFGY